ncbi:hypothetical protein [Maridesulfovibrio sp.]|uniref:hypothetical protein n=1 Tax=Maridesulfovibrio sp. TaxID=2795000 RepID=UPI0039EFA986
MACCVGDQYGGWCNKQELIEINGNQYCIFHAPLEYKQHFKTNFFDALSLYLGESLIKAFNSNSLITYKFDGAVFPHIVFPKCTLKLSFNNCVFEEIADFSNITFNYASFRNCTFNSRTYFSSNIDSKNTACSFFNETDFTSSSFKEEVEFNGCYFEGKTKFENVKFYSVAEFMNCNFTKSHLIDFKHAIFDGTANFICSKHSHINFDLAKFKEEAFFMEFQAVSFWARGTTFSSCSSFDHAIIFENIIFENTYFKDVSTFRRATFTYDSYFIDLFCTNQIIFEGINLCNVWINNGNIKDIVFIDCKWHSDNSYICNNEIYKKELDIKELELQNRYRMLKLTSLNNSDQEQISSWHYKEKEMQRKYINTITPLPDKISIVLTVSLLANIYLSTINNAPIYKSIFSCTIFMLIYTYARFIDFKRSQQWFKKIYLNTYYIISGYGERPLKAFVCLTTLILLPIVTEKAELHTAIFQTFNSTNYLPLVNPLSSSTPIQALYKLGITLQAALFAFALRNKLRR